MNDHAVEQENLGTRCASATAMERRMDSNRISGTVTELGGRVKEAAGALTGDMSLRTEGYYDQAEGLAESTLGRVKDYVAERPVNAMIAAGFIGFILGVWAGRA
ncbi:CsbD family protein [Aquabacter sp. CN5-332]|uniref:CsbD family protein n=1 Tax=Aquabacter sp. CN5-332 TaxID=3156608 RepID=UPI0032B3FD45